MLFLLRDDCLRILHPVHKGPSSEELIGKGLLIISMMSSCMVLGVNLHGSLKHDTPSFLESILKDSRKQLTVSAVYSNVQVRELPPETLRLFHNFVDSLLCWKYFGYQLQHCNAQSKPQSLTLLRSEWNIALLALSRRSFSTTLAVPQGNARNRKG